MMDSVTTTKPVTPDLVQQDAAPKEEAPKVLTPLEQAQQNPVLAAVSTFLTDRAAKDETCEASKQALQDAKAALVKTKEESEETLTQTKAEREAAEQKAKQDGENEVVVRKINGEDQVKDAKRVQSAKEYTLFQAKGHVATLLASLKTAQEDRDKAQKAFDESVANTKATEAGTKQAVEAAELKAEQDFKAAQAATIKALEEVNAANAKAIAEKEAAKAEQKQASKIAIDEKAAALAARIEYFKTAVGTAGFSSVAHYLDSQEKKDFLALQATVSRIRAIVYRSTYEMVQAPATPVAEATLALFIEEYSDLLGEMFKVCSDILEKVRADKKAQLKAFEEANPDKPVPQITLPLPTEATSLFQGIYDLALRLAALDPNQTHQLKKAEEVVQWATKNVESEKEQRIVDSSALRAHEKAQVMLDRGVTGDLKDLKAAVTNYRKATHNHEDESSRTRLLGSINTIFKGHGLSKIDGSRVMESEKVSGMKDPVTLLQEKISRELCIALGILEAPKTGMITTVNG